MPEVFNPGSIRRSYRRILVTGGAGFIGSHMIDFLMQDEKNHVICLDNLFSGEKSNISHWLNHPRFEFLRHDVTDPIQLEVDQIYHMACPASPVFYQFDPIKTTKTAVIGTMNMLDLALRCKARLLLTSTSEIYGEPLVHPQTEDYQGNVNCTGIRSCYDEGKRMGESLCFDYRRHHGVSVRVARIFNTYGPRMLENDGRVVSNFIARALRGQPLVIYGDGSQTRSFCYVSDTIAGLYKLMECEDEQIGPVNIGNDGEYTIKELAEVVANIVHETGDASADSSASPSTHIQYEPLPSDDPTRRRPDISKAAAVLHWRPLVLLRDGMTQTVVEFRTRRGFKNHLP